jgi:long-chain fatty acid transport protein
MLVAGAVWLMAATALGSPFDLYGAGGRAAATAGAQTASAQGPSALYYNAASLVDVDDGVSVGLIAGLNRSRILLMDRPDGYDVPDLGSHSPAVPSGAQPNGRRDTTDLAPLYAFTVGATSSLGLDDFSVGVLLALPSTGYVDVDTHFADERERVFSNQLHYTLIDRRVRRMDLEFGAAYRVADWLSAGMGAAFVPGTIMNTNVFIPDVSRQGDVEINSDVDSESNWGLITGVLVDITDDIALGAQYRSEVFFRIHGTNHIRLGTEGGEEARTIEQELDWMPTYSPDTVALGLSWRLGQAQLLADGRLERWSGFRDSQGQPAGFSDTVSPRVGVEYELGSGNHVRAGLGWVPSPIPEQTGRTNYVDNDRGLASVGASYRLDAFGQPLQVDWGLQFQMLLARHTHKAVGQGHPNCKDGGEAVCDEVPDDTEDPRTGQPFAEAQGLQTGNPGFPGYTSGGWLAGVIVELSWLAKHQ